MNTVHTLDNGAKLQDVVTIFSDKRGLGEKTNNEYLVEFSMSPIHPYFLFTFFYEILSYEE